MSTIAPGSRLGAFEITAPLGAGGMGEVWRARDTRLGRDVAIKVLPPAFTADAERLARFEREAQLLAALNHPNIATIHGLEESSGARALVMELVEGPTLGERLRQGSPTLEEALAIAKQIAEALEFAHEHGIVHRDLKPANVKLRPDGTVKVLDFGLAKAMQGDTGGAHASQLTHSPTLTAAGTVAGTILGTAAYMAPEQAAGLAVDRRADIWAFGVVLWELLAGQQLFSGETVSHVLAAVLKDEPDYTKLAQRVPPPVLDLVRRCLRKKPKQRLQAIGDARVLIEEWLADPSRLEAVAERTVAVPQARSKPVLPWAVAAVALLLAALAGWRALAPGSTADTKPTWLPIALPAGYVVDTGDETSVALSRDGRRLALVVLGEDSGRQLLLKDLDQPEARLLPGTEGASSPAFSPAGEWIAFFAGGEARKVPLSGGPAMTVTANAAQTRGLTWGPDDGLYAALEVSAPIVRLSSLGGEPAPFTTLDPERKERTQRWPHALPGGKAVLFTSDTAESTEFYDDARIEAATVATGERKVLVEQSSRAVALPGGVLIFARAGSLFAARFDEQKLALTSPPVVVLQGVATVVTTGAVHFGVSDTGSLLYVVGGSNTDSIQPLWADASGKTEPAMPQGGSHFQLSLAPDDRRIALIGSNGRTSDLWVADLTRGTTSRLTFEGDPGDPVWSPDGRRLAYNQVSGASGTSNRRSIWWKPADGSAEAEMLWEREAGDLYPMGFSPDGKVLAVGLYTGVGVRSDIWMLPLDGQRKPWPFLENRFSKGHAQFSPDGRFLAYVSDESGRVEVFVRPFPGPGGLWQISTEGGWEPRWSADGRTLYYRYDGSLMRVQIDGRDGFNASRPERVLGGLRSGDNAATYGVARDGRVIVLPPSGGTTRGAQVRLVLDWADEVRRLLAKGK